MLSSSDGTVASKLIKKKLSPQSLLATKLSSSVSEEFSGSDNKAPMLTTRKRRAIVVSPRRPAVAKLSSPRAAAQAPSTPARSFYSGAAQIYCLELLSTSSVCSQHLDYTNLKVTHEQLNLSQNSCSRNHVKMCFFDQWRE